MPELMQVENMSVAIYESRAALGQAAAADFADIVKRAVAERGAASVIMATGNSQIAFMSALREHPDLPWDKVTVFHMDEYLGMSDQHPASFRRFIREKIVDVYHPHAMYGMQGDAPDVGGELARYSGLLEEYKPDLCVMGIGENGHIAFNDPPADFQTTRTIHVVTLDELCRRQQVGEGHFPTMDDVPKQALSLTVQALLKPPRLMVIAPETRKANAVRAALEGPVTPDCPASILRTHALVKLYLDMESAALLRNTR